jgi:hypothetical protein
MVATTLMMLIMDSVDKWRVSLSILVGVTVCDTVGNEGTTETVWVALKDIKVVVNELWIIATDVQRNDAVKQGAPHRTCASNICFLLGRRLSWQ